MFNSPRSKKQLYLSAVSMKTSFALVAFGMLLVSTASSTMAATVMSSTPFFSGGPVPQGLTLVSLPKFDPSLGTLTEVSLTLSSAGSVEVAVDDSASPMAGSVFAVIPGTWSVEGLLGLADLVGTAPYSSGFAGTTVTPVGGSAFLSTADSGLLTPFIATSPGEMTVATVDYSFPASASAVGMATVGVASAGLGEPGFIDLTYTFTPVPEPTALGLALLGLCSPSLIRSRH